MKVNYIDEFFVLRNLSTVLFFLLNRHIACLHISILNLCGRPFSKCTPSSSCVKPVVAFHGRLCPLALLFVRRNPESQALPLLLSFHQHHVVLGSQFFPGCPGLLWLHLGQVPPGAPGTHVMYVHIPVCPPLLQGGQDGTGCQIVTIELVTSEKQRRYPCPRSPKDSTNYRK